MNLNNPKIDGRGGTTLQRLLSSIPKTNPAKYTYDGTIRVPDWEGLNNHFQGIAPVNGGTAVSGQISASADDWWCASFVQGNPGTVPCVFGTGWYDHAGGIQRLGDLLPIGLENDEGKATVAFYDVTNASNCFYKYEFHVTTKASAVAITNYTDSAGVEQALLFVYRYDPKTFSVYRTPVASVESNVWTYITETNVIPDPDHREQFQCFGLATQTSAGNDLVYLVGFRENEAVSLFSVSLGSTNYGTLTHVQTWEGFDGSQWRYGVGLQICNPTKIRIFGCDEDPDGDTDDYTFPIYVWG